MPCAAPRKPRRRAPACAACCLRTRRSCSTAWRSRWRRWWRICAARACDATVPPALPPRALTCARVRRRNVAYLVGPATSFGRDVVPRAAGLLNKAPITDVVALTKDGGFVRPTYTGNALATVRQATQAPCIVTVRASAFPALPQAGSKPAEIQAVPGGCISRVLLASSDAYQYRSRCARGGHARRRRVAFSAAARRRRCRRHCRQCTSASELRSQRRGWRARRTRCRRLRNAR